MLASVRWLFRRKITVDTAMLSTSTRLYTSGGPTSSDPVMTVGSVKALTKDEMRNFKAILPDLIHDLTYEGDHKDMPTVNKHLSQCIAYNVSNGKLIRGTTVPLTLKLLSPEYKSEFMTDANILGWCVEFMQSFFLVSDDMMDQSTTRRGKPCWHLKDGAGLKAINDAILLETCIYTLLDKHFNQKPYYLNILDAFLYVTRHTSMGQSLDLLSSASKEDGNCNLDAFTMKRYANIVKYKTAFYTFYLPVQLGMVVAGIKDPELYRQARTILLAIGHLFQVQDDFLDCFGDPSVTGKIGTDIQDGKCSWLAVVAMQRANSSQKEILKNCYGSKDEKDVAQIKAVYEDLKLKRMFRSYEENSYNDIVHQINHLSGASEKRALNHDIFHSILGRIYKRHN